jgi:rare lipoprotein A
MKMKNYLLFILICTSFVAKTQTNSGYASFIGDKFHGLKMANSETYDKTKLIAGHRSLPFGTKVKITNTNNAQSVIVTIKDRGPFVKGEIIEVSRSAGEAIGMVYDEKAPVRIEVVGTEEIAVTTEKPVQTAPTVTSTSTVKEKTPRTKSVSAPKKATPKPKDTGFYKVDIKGMQKNGYGVQVGLFNDMESVMTKINELAATGFTDIFYLKSDNGYKIILKNYPNYDQANAYKNALKLKYKINGFVVELSEQ